MFSFRARNTNEMQNLVYRNLQEYGVESKSRNGDVLMFPKPTSFTYWSPLERVNFCPLRDANPFFHVMESLAMLAGHNNVEFLSRYATNIKNYSDDGKTFNAFYGSRIRLKWGDQLKAVCDLLMNDPHTRQAVINIWDPADLTKKTVDKACNLSLLFTTQDSKLNMTMFNRSNDLVWGGVSGANVVHFSYFYEYVLCGTGYMLGEITVVSNNAHVYLNDQWAKIKDAPAQTFYETHVVPTPRLYGGISHGFDGELNQFVQDTMRGFDISSRHYNYEFLKGLCVPMYNAWIYHKAGNDRNALEELESISFFDWRIASQSWINRRMK
jgi:thymidylate synthase